MGNTVTLTIGCNVGGTPTHDPARVVETAGRVLGVGAMTAYRCAGWWRGEAETSIRVEVCALQDDEAAAILDKVPALAAALDQEEIMVERRPDSVAFIPRATDEAAEIA